MLQFNLLPDVKKEYIKAKHQKHIILTTSMVSAGVSILIVVLLFSFVQFGQKTNISDMTEDISAKIEEIRSIEDMDKILTIQSQLESLPALHEAKPESSRVFSYLTQLTPANVKIRSVDIDFENSTMLIEGIAPDLVSINRFADTLKFSKYKAVPKPTDDSQSELSIEDAEELEPFSSVTTALLRSEDSSTYEINLVFDPVIYDNTQEVVLIIPNIVTTRSTQGKPSISDQSDNPLFDNSGGQQ